MTAQFPESHRDLLLDETRALAFLATLMPDGSPQVTPVWFDMEDEWIRINTARGRVKDRNMTRRAAVALAIIDPQDLYRYMQIRGRIVRASEEGARVHIDRLARKYLGTRDYEGFRGEVRVIYTVEPLSISTMG